MCNLYVEKRRFRLRWDSNPGLAVDQQSKDLGSNPSAVESLIIKAINIILYCCK